jgi:hypothetical protein
LKHISFFNQGAADFKRTALQIAEIVNKRIFIKVCLKPSMRIRSRYIAWLPLLASGIMSTVAQAQSVKGVVLDAGGKPLQSANILMFRSGDSVLTKGTTSNTNGRFLIDQLSAGVYKLTITSAGFDDQVIKAVEIGSNDVDLGSIHLLSSSKR